MITVASKPLASFKVKPPHRSLPLVLAGLAPKNNATPASDSKSGTPLMNLSRVKRKPLRVGLLMLIVDNFPPWWPFLAVSYRRNHPYYELIAVHTGVRPPESPMGDSHIRYEQMSEAQLAKRFAEKLGASLEQALALTCCQCYPMPCTLHFCYGIEGLCRNASPHGYDLQPSCCLTVFTRVALAQVKEKLSSSKGLSDLKPFYGKARLQMY